MRDHEFKVGDVVLYIRTADSVEVHVGKMGVVFRVDYNRKRTINIRVKFFNWCDSEQYVDGWGCFSKNLVYIGPFTEMSDGPLDQTPPPAPDVSPASDTQTSSARGNRRRA